ADQLLELHLRDRQVGLGGPPLGGQVLLEDAAVGFRLLPRRLGAVDRDRLRVALLDQLADVELDQLVARLHRRALGDDRDDRRLALDRAADDRLALTLQLGVLLDRDRQIVALDREQVRIRGRLGTGLPRTPSERRAGGGEGQQAADGWGKGF